MYCFIVFLFLFAYLHVNLFLHFLFCLFVVFKELIFFKFSFAPWFLKLSIFFYFNPTKHNRKICFTLTLTFLTFVLFCPFFLTLLSNGDFPFLCFVFCTKYLFCSIFYCNYFLTQNYLFNFLLFFYVRFLQGFFVNCFVLVLNNRNFIKKTLGNCNNINCLFVENKMNECRQLLV